MAELSRIGVLGCGLMGHGITQVAAQSGYEVVVREVDQGRLDKGVGRIEKQLARAVEKGRVEQADAEAARGRITPTLEYGDLADSDLVIEAITEDLPRKLEMWGEVDGLVKPEAFLATNTSSLPVIDQAAATSRPDRFLGLHFFNPVQVMKLLEVIRGGDDVGRGLRRRHGLRAEARQAHGRDARHRRLHRQPAAGAVPARRRSAPTRRAWARSRRSTRP